MELIQSYNRWGWKGVLLRRNGNPVEEFVNISVKGPNRWSDKRDWHKGEFTIKGFNGYVFPLPIAPKYFPPCIGLDIKNIKPFCISLQNAFINQVGVVFDQAKKVVNDSLNSYFETASVVRLPPRRSAINDFLKSKFPWAVCFLLRNKWLYSYYARSAFSKAEIIELDNKYRYVMFFDHFHENFTHFMVESYPRLYAFMQNLSASEKSNLKVIVPIKKQSYYSYNPWEFIDPCLNALGITEDKRIYLQENKILMAKTLYLPSHVKLLPVVVNSSRFLIDSLPTKSAVNTYERIYISRRAAMNRKLSNEQECMNLLDKHGFKEILMEDYSFQEKISIMQAAKVVITTDSSATTNIIFCKPGTKILLLTFANMPIYNLFLCSIYDMDFCYQFCTPQGEDCSWHSANLHVDLPALEQKLLNWGV